MFSYDGSILFFYLFIFFFFFFFYLFIFFFFFFFFFCVCVSGRDFGYTVLNCEQGFSHIRLIILGDML